MKEQKQRIQCHFISNTHWDREWRYSAQRTRHMLASMLEMVFDIFERDAGFAYFHLDSQTMPIQDYLEVYPEKTDLVKKYVSEGKLLVGPWFCLPDEFCVSGESLIRNLLLGHKMAKELGAVSKTGYSPFGWGQISQLPQIYLGFGIDVASFYRGINTYVAPRSEFIWESPDGSRIIASRLGARPRYNVWYVVQRPVYWNLGDENNREMSWRAGHAPFHFVDKDKREMDYQYAHPRFEYHAENVPRRAAQAIEEQDGDWSTPHRFWSAGHDSSSPDIREVRMIADCAEALRETADVFPSTVKAFQEGLKAERRADWPVVRGEMRHPYTKGSVSALMGWIISARTWIKQENFRTERDLILYAEPLAVFAALLGAPYPKQFIATAYNWLLQNHGHDSIGGCGRDVVYDDVAYRFHQSREISACVTERAMMDIAGSVDLTDWTPDMMALVVLNPLPFARSGVVDLAVEIPLEWTCQGIEILDVNGGKLPLQVCGKTATSRIVQSPNDVANFFPVVRYAVRAELPAVPGMGYTTYRIAPLGYTRSVTPRSLRTSVNTMENEFLAVTMNPNGTFDLTDKQTGGRYLGLGYFVDSGEVGNPWEHVPPENDAIYTTLAELARISVTMEGELETAFRVEIDWPLPLGRTQSDKARCSATRVVRIVSEITLRKGQRWLEIETTIENTVEDHYLRVCFPTRINSEHVHVQSQFDVVQRPVATPDYSLFDERPMSEHPMCSFVDIDDGTRGLALLNEGLKAYTSHDDEQRTIDLTLLRCFPLRICVTQEMTDYSDLDKGSQCLGQSRYRYGVMPHRGDWVEGDVWRASESFNAIFHAAQIGPSQRGRAPLTRSFLELDPATLHVSALKKSEMGDGWMVRLFNPFDHVVNAGMRLNGGRQTQARVQSAVERVQAEFELPNDSVARWRMVRLVSLEEEPLEELRSDVDGWVRFQIGGKKVLTVEFLR